MEFSTLLYFANLGIFCGCITMGISYILAQTMNVMQDKPDTKRFKLHTKTTPLCGGISIFIAYVVVVLGGIEIPFISHNNHVSRTNTIFTNMLDFIFILHALLCFAVAL